MGASSKNSKKSGIGKPTLDEVKRYFFKQKFIPEEGEVFYFFYRSVCWHWQFGELIVDWKIAARKWMWNLEN